MTDEELHELAVVIMAATWIKNQAKDMPPRDDVVRLALAVSKVSLSEATTAAAKMLRALSESEGPSAPVLHLPPGGRS